MKNLFATLLTILKNQARRKTPDKDKIMFQSFNDNADRFESDEYEPALRKGLRANGKL